MSAPVYDLTAGQYRTLRRPRGERLGARLDRPPITRYQRELAADLGLDPPERTEWYARRNLSWSRTVLHRTKGPKPRQIADTTEFHVTTGLALGGLGLLLAWEAAQSIAHGLAGLDPLNWTADVADWLEGKPSRTNVVDNSVGGLITGHVLALLGPAPPPAEAPTPTNPPSSPIVAAPSSSGLPEPLPLPFEPII